ncbi:MAG: c-type cytochrome biogenesis protein CcmI [Ketobacteraceae bacterium]|nr:c-type cytochrome biogenesis protein CcmI [Ketobacteraceae bacterium]
MIFWIILVCLALIAAWFLVFPTLQAKPSEDTSRQALNAKIFRQRMDELEADYKAGRTDQEDYESLKTELERNFLADMERAEAEGRQAIQTSKGVILSLVVIVPVVTLVVYKTTGYNQTIAEWFSVQERMDPYIDRMITGELEPEELQRIPMADFVYALQRRAQTRQNAAELWFILGNTYLQVQTGNPNDQRNLLDNATKALRRAHYLDESNIEYALTYTQALLAQNQGRLDIESRKILKEVLSQSPNNPSALMMLAMAAYQSEDYQTAITGWERLLAMGANQKGYEKAQSIIKNSIRQAKLKLAEQQAPAADQGVSVVIKLADDVTANMNQGFLMVYAQAEAGPPMPLAIKKLPLPQRFPVSVSLSDEDAMMPSMKISLFDKVKVTARLSESGQATPQKGDWLGVTRGVATKATGTTSDITIQRQVE